MDCSGRLVENCIILGVFGGFVALMSVVLIVWTLHQTSCVPQPQQQIFTQTSLPSTPRKIVVVVTNPVLQDEDPKN